jgi:hypothetical protein
MPETWSGALPARLRLNFIINLCRRGGAVKTAARPFEFVITIKPPGILPGGFFCAFFQGLFVRVVRR